MGIVLLLSSSVKCQTLQRTISNFVDFLQALFPRISVYWKEKPSGKGVLQPCDCARLNSTVFFSQPIMPASGIIKNPHIGLTISAAKTQSQSFPFPKRGVKKSESAHSQPISQRQFSATRITFPFLLVARLTKSEARFKMALPRIQSDSERMTIELNSNPNSYGSHTITFNGLTYDIVNGHWYIDGRYGYSSDQRICEDNSAGICMGVTN